MTYHQATALLLFLGGASAALKPKMVQEEFFEGKPLGPPTTTIHVETNMTTFLGECAPGAPFTFPLYGSWGRGAIGFVGDVTFAASLADDIEAEHGNTGQIELYPDQIEANFFAIEGAALDDYQGIPFDYHLDVEPWWDEGSAILLECDVATEVVVLVNDNIDLKVDAVVTEHNDGDEIEIVSDGPDAVAPLKGSSRGKGQGKIKDNEKGKDKNKGRALEETWEPLAFEEAETTGKHIKFHRSKSDDEEDSVALVDGIFELSDGRKVRRTSILNSKKKHREAPKSVTIQCCTINDDGDVEMQFPDLATGDRYLRVDARLALGITDSDGTTTELTNIVDVSAMFKEGDAVTVHGGWVRRAVHELGLSENIQDDGFEVSVVDVKVSDPEDEYRNVGVMGNVVANGVSKEGTQRHKRRHLMRTPTDEEMDISEDMKVGRRPKDFKQGLRRGLKDVVHKKILVHGYCSATNPFPIDQFTNAIAFASDLGGAVGNNWSHDEFARRIDAFADDNGIYGCGIIAHSQGGAAALHLKTYYHSCLDNASLGEKGDKLIQSVGTPYGGTPLSGNLAALANAFGFMCGTNYDMTTSGAASWLSNIPNWARSKVTYYTTSCSTAWWSYDYCNLASDLILSGYEDGTTEKSRGQLSGATNGGHKTGWCHTATMRDPAQTRDSRRNSAMNSNARY